MPRDMDKKYEAVKAVFWNIGALEDLLSLKAFWRIACSKHTPLNPRGDLFHLAPGSNQNLASDICWIQVKLRYARLVVQRKNIPIHTPPFIHHLKYTLWYGGVGGGLLGECMRLWSSLRCLIDHDAFRTWQASWAEWRIQGEGHLHVETALSKQGHEGSHSATLTWPRQYMSMSNQAEQQIPHLLWLPQKIKNK